MFYHLNLIQTVWNLVRSSWILHASCNKRKVAPIAALLSAVLHSSIFSDERMHNSGEGSGPLKWVCSLCLSKYYVSLSKWATHSSIVCMLLCDLLIKCYLVTFKFYFLILYSLLKKFLRKAQKVLVQFVLLLCIYRGCGCLTLSISSTM